MAAVVAVSLSLVRIGSADLVPVPLDRQAELLARVAAYDRNMLARAGDRVRVLLVTNGNDPESVGLAKRMEAALQSPPREATTKPLRLHSGSRPMSTT